MRRSSRTRRSFERTTAAFLPTLPTIIGVVALTSLILAAVPARLIAEALPMEGALGPLLGAVAGSVASGHAMTSYVLAGELLSAGLSLATATAFLVAWVTVGLVQLPAEIAALGSRFALCRNAVSFVLAVLTAYATAAAVIAFG